MNKEEILKQIEELKRQVELLDKPTFEVGKWYKMEKDNLTVDSLFCLTKETKYDLYGYGFVGCTCLWRNEQPWTSQFNKVLPATESEVFEALKKEAIKRGFKEGVTIVSYLPSYGYNDKRKYTLNNCGASYEKYKNALRMGGSAIFHNGVWAEIIKDEPIKIGGYEVKKEQNPFITYKVGCKNLALKEIVQIRDFMQIHNFTKLAFDGIETDLETINKILNL